MNSNGSTAIDKDVRAQRVRRDALRSGTSLELRAFRESLLRGRRRRQIPRRAWLLLVVLGLALIFFGGARG